MDDSEAVEPIRRAGVLVPEADADGVPGAPSRKLYFTVVASRASECDELFE